MDELVPQRDEIPAENNQEELTIPEPGKTLYISEKTKGFNYKAILGQVLQIVNMSDILAKIELGTQYVVQIPTELQEAYNAGDLFMMQNHKTGKMWPSLMKIGENGKNQIVSPLPIAEQEIIQGNPVQDLAISYHNMLMQQQIARLTNMVEDTYHLVERIEHGQMDDRVGLLEAGNNGLLLAMSMPKGQEQTMQINSSRQNVLVAQSQIGKTLKRRVEEFIPIPKSKFKQFVKELGRSGYLSSKDREIDEIQEYYDLYLQATKLIAASYVITGDLQTAENSFRIGEQFIQTIDFSKVKSIEYSHKELRDMFYATPVEYIATEKQEYLEEAKDYDYVSIEVCGKKLLEMIENGREKKIQEADAE